MSILLRTIVDNVLRIVSKHSLKSYNVYKNYDKLSKMKFKLVVSYATRPMRNYETNGKEHKFVTEQEATRILIYNDPVAYTRIGKYEYFVIEPQIKGSDNNLYIIDPQGIYSLYDNKR